MQAVHRVQGKVAGKLEKLGDAGRSGFFRQLAFEADDGAVHHDRCSERKERCTLIAGRARDVRVETGKNPWPVMAIDSEPLDCDSAPCTELVKCGLVTTESGPLT